MVRAEGLEPPQAIAHQDLNLGKPIPASPNEFRKPNDHEGFRRFHQSAIPANPCLSQRVGLQLGCSSTQHPPPISPDLLRAMRGLLPRPTRAPKRYPIPEVSPRLSAEDLSPCERAGRDGRSETVGILG